MTASRPLNRLYCKLALGFGALLFLIGLIYALLSQAMLERS